MLLVWELRAALSRCDVPISVLRPEVDLLHGRFGLRGATDLACLLETGPLLLFQVKTATPATYGERRGELNSQLCEDHSYFSRKYEARCYCAGVVFVREWRGRGPAKEGKFVFYRYDPLTQTSVNILSAPTWLE